ncbi:MAG: GNAT family N-acetyltransferase [Cryobacterium sp.]|nr:GNAT family N-acetyltransferase [Cryobacterium sp.]
MRIRPLESVDIGQVSAINGAGVPGVTPADADEVARLVELSELSLVAVDDSDDAAVLGFLLVMAPGADYESENYRWFSERGPDFLYIDRIAIAEGRRGEGIGDALYRELFRVAAEQGRAEVTCEVNTMPPNPGSMRFHERLGFERVGELVTKGGAYEVALLARTVARA